MRAKKVAQISAFLGCLLLIAANVLAVRFGFATDIMEWGEESVQNAAVVSPIFVVTWVALRGVVALGRWILRSGRERRGA
ncbi:MAG: hypothetical protein AAB562_03340 [Patescibacteria group bacterium]